MQRFDTKSNLDRLIQRAQANNAWSQIIEQGAIGGVFSSIAEGENELARYLEYLFNEKKWKTARNISSLSHSASMISYKRSRPKSALGYVLVSHTDIMGQSRLPNYGVSFFSLDQRSDYDDLIMKTNATSIERAALVPWSYSEPYTVPALSQFDTQAGISFFSTKACSIRPLKEQYSLIEQNPTKYNDFIQAGGWNGIKYLKIPVIQGKQAFVNFGMATGARFESFKIESTTVEAAVNSISRDYFIVKVIPRGKEEKDAEIWQEIANIYLAGPYDKVFETKLSNSGDGVLLKFGDDITGQRLPVDQMVTCDYITTDGAAGNIDQKFQVTKLTFPNGQQMVDPRTQKTVQFLQCTNVVPIMGGRDAEQENDFKNNAPADYLRSYAIASTPAYDKQIMTEAPVSLLRLKIFSNDVVTSKSYGNNGETFMSKLDNSVLTEVNNVQKSVVLTCVKSNGEKLDDPYGELLDPITMALSSKMSPNDTFDYIEPNFVKLRPNIQIMSTSNIVESDVKDQVSDKILGEYSIFNQEFAEAYYKSKVTEISQSFPFSTGAKVFMEQLATINPVPVIMPSNGATDNSIFTDVETPPWERFYPGTLLAFEFNFDKLFAQSLVANGFRNFKNSAPYLLRVDLKFLADSTRDVSFFLLDNRVDNVNVFNVTGINESETDHQFMTAETQPLDPTISVPNVQFEHSTDIDPFYLFNELVDYYDNRQARTAQYEFIKKITTDEYVSLMKQTNVDPREQRPLYTNDDGVNQQFETDLVPSSERVSLSFTPYTTGTSCYRQNSQYWNYTKILYFENYNNVLDKNYAHGYFICPIDKILTNGQLQSLIQLFETPVEMSYMAQEISRMINNTVEIKVYAQPLMNEYKALNAYDEIFTDETDVLVEKILP